MPISMGKQYRTKSGLPVRVLAVDVLCSRYPVAALVKDGERENYASFTSEGGYHLHEKSALDLVEVPPEVRVEGDVLNARGEWVTLVMTWRGTELLRVEVAP